MELVLKHLIVLFFLAACSQTVVTPPIPDPVVIKPDPVAESRIKTLWPNGALDIMAKEAVLAFGSVMLTKVPSDYANWCPKFKDYSKDDRLAYWSSVLSVMAKYESNFRTALTYKEPFNDRSGKNVISRGLLQMSIESCRGYGMKLDSADELHQPSRNLECGVRVINRWLDRDGMFIGKSGRSWRGSSQYWSVLRSSHNVHNRLLVDLKSLCI